MRRLLIVCIVMCFAFVGNIMANDGGDGFEIHTIDDATFERIKGKSFKTNGTTRRDDLRYLTLMYINENGKAQHGEMICNKAIAKDLIEIFRELYRQRYPIHSIRLVDEYDADDETSMEANNTSCFNYRGTSSGARLSKHAQGMAIDINPLWNPCIHLSGRNAGKIEPRNAKRTHKIDRNDLCYKLFVKHGFRWGGAWKSLKDYQHFEK